MYQKICVWFGIHKDIYTHHPTGVCEMFTCIVVSLLVSLFVSVFIGMFFRRGRCMTPEEQAKEDQEQIDYLATWSERRK
jgi:hypothetical protein